MTTLSRQNTLFVAEDWVKIYDAIQNVDFRAYDQTTLTQAILDYLRVNYSEEFNDWIASSEFVTKVEILAWLSQNLSFRIDLNKRENILSAAERREAILNLAYNIAYKVNRVRGARGEVKLISVRTDQPIVDSNNTLLQNVTINWNDPANEDWYEQFITVMNRAFTARTQYGKPVVRYVDGLTKVEQYLFNSRAPLTGVYSFTGAVNGANLPFEVVNSALDPTTGVISEIAPNPVNIMAVHYRSDGRGTGSDGTGFFLPVRQGTLGSLEQNFDTPEIMRTFVLPQININNDDLFVQQIDSDGNVLTNWTRVDTVFGEGIGFNTLPSTITSIYETETLPEDQVRIRFGDGKFGAIPTGLFRFWYRTSNPQPFQIKPENVEQKTITLPYVNDGQIFYLSLTFSLMESIVNAAASELNTDIKTRAGSVQYAQNRMITARDYNTFILGDSSIMKAKVVNRTFSGHSRYAKLNDPTGVYENIKVLGEDGRLYIKDTRTAQLISANTDVLTNDQLITQYVKPILRKLDKRVLYYNVYPEQYVSGSAAFDLGIVVGPNAKGNIKRGNTAQPVGSFASSSDALRFVGPDSLIRFKRINGPVASVQKVIGNGTATDGIIFREKNLEDGAAVVAVMPPIRNQPTSDEIAAFKQQLGAKLTFGVSWNQEDAEYHIIVAADLDKNGDFSLVYQGDTTSANKDASWLFYAEYVPGSGGNDDRWRIVDRGQATYWESANEIDFFYASDSEPIFDLETGRALFDTINALGINESKMSLRRRGLAQTLLQTCGIVAYAFTGDGETACFKTKEHPIDTGRMVVLVDEELMIVGADYTITTDLSGDYVCFVTAPAEGANVEIRFSDGIVYANQQVRLATSDGTLQEFALGVSEVAASNIISAVDGAFQNPGRDYTISSISNQASILYDSVLPTGTNAMAFVLGDTSSNVFVKTDYLANGTQTKFGCNVKNQRLSSVVVIVDGVFQTPGVAFTIDNTTDSTTSLINFTAAPPANVRVVIYAARVPSLVRAHYHTFVADGVTSVYTLTGIASFTQYQPIVTLDGMFQKGPYANTPDWTINGQNRVQFAATPGAGVRITILTILGAVGIRSDLSELVDNDYVEPADPCAMHEVESCYVSYMGCDASWQVSGVLRHDDGFTNVNGLEVIPADTDQSGISDNPFLFKDLVLADGVTDLVLWRRVTEYGYSVWQAITSDTTPKGTYGTVAATGIQAGSTYDTAIYAADDIHYDVTNDQWLVADGTSGEWVAAGNQSAYRHEIGRDGLKFIWTHYSSDQRRIDMAKSNLHDAYLLIRSFYDAYAAWIRINGAAADEPQPPSAESLRVQYQSFQDFKVDTDTLVFHPARIKPLFGPKAIPELRSTFKCIKTPGSRLSDNDLRLRVLRAIEDYFSPDNWDFGSSFYFTELVAYVHQQLAPDLQSMVIVPKDSDQVFGRLFQIRSEPDELFISSAQPDDIELVSSFTDEELRIGSF